MIKFIRKLFLKKKEENSKVSYYSFRRRVQSKIDVSLEHQWRTLGFNHNDEIQELQRQYGMRIISSCLNYEKKTYMSSRLLLSAIVDALNYLEAEEQQFDELLEHNGEETVQ